MQFHTKGNDKKCIRRPFYKISRPYSKSYKVVQKNLHQYLRIFVRIFFLTSLKKISTSCYLLSYQNQAKLWTYQHNRWKDIGHCWLLGLHYDLLTDDSNWHSSSLQKVFLVLPQVIHIYHVLFCFCFCFYSCWSFFFIVLC